MTLAVALVVLAFWFILSDSIISMPADASCLERCLAWGFRKGPTCWLLCVCICLRNSRDAGIPVAVIVLSCPICWSYS